MLVAPLGLLHHLVSVQQAEGVNSLMVRAVESNRYGILIGMLSCAGHRCVVIVVVMVVVMMIVADLIQIAG